MMEAMKVNWNCVCEQLNGVSGSPSYADEKNTVTKIIKNVYHRKSVSAVVIEEVGIYTHYAYYVWIVLCPTVAMGRGQWFANLTLDSHWVVDERRLVVGTEWT